ncbi:MAG: hypothetical protein AAB572_02190, partial [Patescibacteria group bacterium]
PQIIIFVLALAVVAGGYFVFGNKTQAPQPQAPTSTVSEINIAGWKTYLNQKYGFSIVYPPNWLLNDQSFTYMADENISIRITAPTRTDLSEQSGLYPHFYIQLYPGNVSESVSSVVMGFRSEYGFEVTPVGSPELVQLKNTSEQPEYKIAKQIVEKSKYWGSVDYWQTYSNKQYGVEFKYPSNWYQTTREFSGQVEICLNPIGIQGDCTGILVLALGSSIAEQESVVAKTFSGMKIEKKGRQDGSFFTISSEKEYGGYTKVFIGQSFNVPFRFEMLSGYEDVFDKIFFSSIKFTQPFQILSPKKGEIFYADIGNVNVHWPAYVGEFDSYSVSFGNSYVGSMSPRTEIIEPVSKDTTSFSRRALDLMGVLGGKSPENVKDGYYIRVQAMKGTSVVQKSENVFFNIESVNK